jgi:uncharacterized protein
MRIVVTGGTGLIGHELVMSLGQDGHEIDVLSRNPRQAGNMPETIRFHKWDAKTAAGWGYLVDGANAVINLAGASVAGDGFLPTRWTPERKKLILESRVNAGKALVEAIQQANVKPKMLIQSSAVGYYGPQGDKKVTEDHPAGDDFLADVCVQWEASTLEVEAMGVRRVLIRTGVVLSDKGGALPRQIVPFQLFAGGPIGSGKQYYPWIHIEDEVRAIRFLLENDNASGAFNLAAPNPETNASFSRAIGRVLKRPAFVPVPGFAFQIMFGEVSTVLLDGQRAVPARLADMGFTFTYSDAEVALHDLYG